MILIKRLQAWVQRWLPLHFEYVSARLAGNGTMVEVRYRLTKPMPNPRRRYTPYAVEQGSGLRLEVQRIPYVGALASRPLKPNVLDGYFLLDNSAQRVQAGMLLTVVLGPLEQKNLRVE